MKLLDIFLRNHRFLGICFTHDNVHTALFNVMFVKVKFFVPVRVLLPF